MGGLSGGTRGGLNALCCMLGLRERDVMVGGRVGGWVGGRTYRSQVRRNRFLNLAARPFKSPPNAAVKNIMEAILYTPMVGHSIQYLAQATHSCLGGEVGGWMGGWRRTRRFE